MHAEIGIYDYVLSRFTFPRKFSSEKNSTKKPAYANLLLFCYTKERSTSLSKFKNIIGSRKSSKEKKRIKFLITILFPIPTSRDAASLPQRPSTPCFLEMLLDQISHRCLVLYNLVFNKCLLATSYSTFCSTFYIIENRKNIVPRI